VFRQMSRTKSYVYIAFRIIWLD